jgi:signal transduction histidine kinase
MPGIPARTRRRVSFEFRGDELREERIRLARDIHDGVLQALTGVALQIEAVSRLMTTDPALAHAGCKAVGASIEAEQRELRCLIREWSSTLPSWVSMREAHTLFDDLRHRTAAQWSLHVDMRVGGRGRFERSVLDDAYSIVREALANVGRHAKATVARVVLFAAPDAVRIGVLDDGCGFPFHGRYDLSTLIARNIGPVSLRERVAAARGALTIVSCGAGSSVEVSLPRAARHPSATDHRVVPVATASVALS